MSVRPQDIGWTPARSVAGHRNPWSIVAVISIATFMVVLDTSIANVSLANIAGNLAVSYEQATWVLTSYLVSNAVILPASGWLADVLGRKSYYMMSVALFTASSLVCGLAPNLTVLIVARVFQGLGGGGLQTVEQSMLADTFPPSQRGMAFAVYGIVVIIAPILGPTLGGWITDHLSWHWVFLINVPIGIASLSLVRALVAEPPALRAHTASLRTGGIRFDYVGFSFVALALGLLEVTLDRGQQDDWFASPMILWFAIVAAIAFVALIPWEFMQRRPIINVHLFKRRNFAIAEVLFLALGAVLFGTTQFIPQLLQQVLGYTAETAGLALTYGGVATLFVMPLVGILSGRVDARYLVAVGFLGQAVAFWAMGQLSTQMSFFDAAFVRMLQSIGLPLLFVPLTTAAYVGLRPWENNQASALMNVVRNLGGTIGISVVQTLLARGRQRYQSQLVNYLIPSNANYTNSLRQVTRSLSGQGAAAHREALGVLFGSLQKQAQMLTYLEVFHVMLWVTICVVPLVFLMRRPRPHALAEGAL